MRIGGRGPYKFFIDTGASVSVVDAEIAAALGLEVVGSQTTGAPGGPQINANMVAIPSMVAGDLTIEGATALVLDIAKLTGGVMEGLLGMDLFGEVLLTLDPGQDRAIIARGTLEAGGLGVIQADDSRGRLIFPIDVAGQSVQAQMDHGSPSGLTLGIEMIDLVPTRGGPEIQAEARMVGGRRTVRTRTLDGAIRFAGLEYQNPRVGFMDPAPGTANIGSEILNDLAVTIDWRNARIAFQRAAATPAVASSAAAQVPRRLGIQFRGTGGGGGFSEVAMVESGSFGEQAGFRPGDTLVSLNSRPMSQYDQGTLGSLIRGTGPLRWEIERNGERIVIEIP